MMMMTKVKADRRTSSMWWNDRSFLERILSFVAFVSLVLCIISLTALVILSYRISASNDRKLVNARNKAERQVCLTPGCIKAAAEILNYVNESVDPCDDFYSFSCGNWLKKTTIPEDQSSTSIWAVLGNELHRRLLELIKSIGEDQPPYMQNMKNSFNACMNITEIEHLGSDPLKSILRDLGGWPVVEDSNWNNYFFDWMDTLKSIRKMGLDYNIFTKLSVKPDIRNNARYIIQLDQPYLGIDYAYLLKGLEDPVVSAYYQLMVDSAVLLGANIDVAKKEMLRTLRFEIRLADIFIHREQRRNISNNYNKMKGSDLHKLAPEIQWNTYLDMLLNQNIPAGEEISVRAPTYVKKMSELVASKGYGEERRRKKRILANYMLWRVVLKSMPFLNKRWRDLNQKYFAVLTGELRESDRWMQCLDGFTWKLSSASGSIYARNYLDEETRSQVAVIADYVHKAFLKTLRSVKWMDDETRNKAVKKAKNMIMYISYPDEFLDHDKISAIYSDLHLDPSDHFGNYRELNKWSADYSFSKLRKQRKRGDWKNWWGIASVNAYYHAEENTLEIPGALLQDFFFSPEKPNYLNFGTVGSVIGHEVTHGFDDEGRQYDYMGNNFNWWKEETDSNFKERAQCMIDQYTNYTDPEIEMAVNGINTLGENIADNAAIKEAYWAYRQWVFDNGEEAVLPSLRYTPMQLFWISFAMSECTKQKPEDLKHQVMSGRHSPSYNRVIGPVTNSEEFSKEFDCPVGSPMNPVNKCVIW